MSDDHLLRNLFLLPKENHLVETFAGNMEENCYNALPLMILPSDGGICSNGDAACYSEADPGHQFTSNESSNLPMALPQWIYSQQTPQNYFQFLTENSVASGVQNPASQFNFNPSPSSGFRALSIEMATDKVGSVKLPHEVATLSNSSGSENPTPSQVVLSSKNPIEEYDNAALNYPPKISQSSRGSGNDSRRRKKIAEGLEALQELLPHSRRGGKAAMLDDVMDYVKQLQFQIKELSQSRLGGESSGTSSVFLEGCGHYFLEDQMSNGSLEDMMGKLLEVNPFAATQLLESRGLLMMPIAFAEGLHLDV